MPNISVVMATFNGGRFLEDQLLSLARQTQPPFELIVCDDGSSDETIELLHRFTRQAAFPVVIQRNRARLGYRANFMQAATLARGELISFCDQDDVWRPEKLSRVASAFDDPSILLVAHQLELIDEAGEVIGTLDQGEARSGDFDVLTTKGPWCLLYGLSQTFRASLLRHKDLWITSKSHFQSGEAMGHDRWIAFMAAVLGKVTLLPDRLVQYRQHGANAFGAPVGGGRNARAPSPPAIGALAPAKLEIQIGAAQDRVRMLMAVAGDSGPFDTAGVQSVLIRFQGLERRLLLRAAVLQFGSLARRLAALRALVLAGGYRDRDLWRFRRRAFLTDLMAVLRSGLTAAGGAGAASRWREAPQADR